MTTTIGAPPAERTRARGCGPGGLLVSEFESDEALDKPAIAELSNQTIEAMSAEELRRLIAASDHPWAGRRLERRLAYCDRETLLRLAFLARRCCRNQGY